MHNISAFGVEHISKGLSFKSINSSRKVAQAEGHLLNSYKKGGPTKKPLPKVSPVGIGQGTWKPRPGDSLRSQQMQASGKQPREYRAK